MDFTELVTRWREEVYNRWQVVDPEGEYHWDSMAYGWALAKALSPKQAREFVLHITETNII